MNKLINTCRRCLNPWVVGLIIVVIIGLIIFIPVVRVASLIAVLPLMGCAVMCGAMAIFMREEKK